MKRNLTIALDEEVVAKARVVAARRGTSISGLVAEELTRLVEAEEGFEAARRSAMARLARGAHLGGGPLPSRDERHRRR